MSRTVLGVGGAIGFALLATLALFGPAAGHSLPQSSVPGRNSSVPTAPSQVSITFGEAPDPKLSSITVLDSTGAKVTTGPTVVAAGDSKTLSVPVGALPNGVYTVKWRTVSAVDGHTATGNFAFGVGVTLPALPGGAAPPQESSSSSASLGAIIGRWLLFMGIVGLVGAGFFGAVIAHPTRTLSRRVMPVAWLVAAVGTAVVVIVQVADAQVDPSQILDTSFGPIIVERIIPLAIAAGLIAVLWFWRRESRVTEGLVSLAGIGAMLADVGASHAAASLSFAYDVTVQAGHIIAVGFWIGGLVGLVLSIRGEPSAEKTRMAHRFATTATVGIAIVAVTGLLRAISEVQTVDALFNTDFGRVVILKSALFGGLAFLGAMNHFRNVPGASFGLHGLRRAGSIELVIAATILLASAWLVNLAPPSEQGPQGNQPTASAGATPSPIDIVASDFGRSVNVELVVSPGTPGFNSFQATVTGFDSKQPITTAAGVTLRFALPARPDIGQSRLDLTPAGAPGVFSSTGANISLGGAWTVTATVVNGTSSVEVPFTVTTLAAPPTPTAAPTTSGLPGPSGTPTPSGQPTPTPTLTSPPSASCTRDVAAGQPTIYTCTVPSGKSVQVYLDPGSAGPNLLHVTWFDAAGNEIPITTMTGSLTAPDGTVTQLPWRLYDTGGHFISDTREDVGTYVATVQAHTPDGEDLDISIQLDVPLNT